MNNQSFIIGLLVALVLLGGGWMFLTTINAVPGGTATTTPSGTDTQGFTPTPTPDTGSAAAPSVVTDRNVSPSNSTAVVTGKVTPNGAPTAYWYEYGVSATLGERTSSQSVGSGWSAIPSPGYITGLRANTLYYFRLSAQNAYGTVNGAMYSFNTNDDPPPPGLPPTASTNAATDVTRVSATLNARVNPRGSQTTYWFEYGGSTELGQVAAFQSGGSGEASLTVSASVSGLNPLTKYYFRINAQNQFGTVNGATQSFTTKGPASPGAPTADTRSASDVGTSTATLNGRVNQNGDETTYWFEYSTDSLLGAVLRSTTERQAAGRGRNLVSVDADVSDLNSKTTYFFRLVAENSMGVVRGDRVTLRTK